MNRSERITYLIAAGLFTYAGILQIDGETKLIFPILSFLVAGVFFYLAFGKKVLKSCSFSEMNKEARKLVTGRSTKALSRNQAVRVAAVTFLAVVVSFGMGFGIGKLLYHFTN